MKYSTVRGHEDELFILYRKDFCWKEEFDVV